MNFTSLPSYLDTQHWHQQPNHHQLGNTTTSNTTTNTNENHQQLPPPPPGQPQSSIRPNSMTDRARLAKIPQPESALKCPRCDSTNTKFCYFNNYSLSQPRHFCKTCRRYWTRGGALRNVPVGGGCRRNKRSKGSRSKSPVSGTQKGGGGGGGGPSTSTTSSTNTASSLPSNSFSSDHMMANMTPSLLPQLPFMNTLHHLHDYGDHMGLSFSAIQAPLGQGSIGGASDMDFQLGSSTTTNATAVGGGGGGGNMLSDQWRSLQQFPFLGGGTYSFDGDMAAAAYSKPSGSVKMEENQGFNLSRQFLGIHGNDQYWGGGSGASGGGGGGGGGGNGGVGNAWTDLSGFTSSTTSHQLL